MPGFTRKLKGRFPQNLNAAAAFLPTRNCSLRRDLEKWFESIGIEPRVVAEFEDAALTKLVATSGEGFIAIPTVVISEAVAKYGFVPIGSTKEVETHFYTISAERRFTHQPTIAIPKKLKTKRKEISR